MLRFLEFIFESKKVLVPYYFSDRLRGILSDIENKDITRGSEASNIASDLLKHGWSDNTEGDVTFIDIVDNRNDMLSFLSSDRALRIYNSDKDKGDYDSFKMWLSFKSKDFTSSVWRQQRGESRIGKFVRKIVTGKTDAQIEKFVNDYKSRIDSIAGEDNFELVSGELIRHYYSHLRYYFEEGTLGNSCMRHHKCQKYLNIYVQNPEVVSLLILKHPSNLEKIIGRALVWKTEKGYTVMDRIYTINDSDVNLFDDYARKRGWILDPSSKSTVRLEKWKFDEYPYMDTYVCLELQDGILSADESNWPGDHWCKLQNTDGTYIGDSTVWSNYHRDYIERDNAVWCEHEQDYVDSNDAIFLEYLDTYVTPNADVCYSNYDGNDYYLDDSYYSEYMEDYIHKDDMVIIYINAAEDTDYIHKDFDGALVDVLCDGQIRKSLPKFVIFNPVDGYYHFKDDKIGGLPITDYIVDNYGTGKDRMHPEYVNLLEEYILNSEFNVDNFRSKLKVLLIPIVDNRNDLSGILRKRIITSLPPTDLECITLSNILKYMVITSPTISERRANYNPTVNSWEDFKEKTLSKRPDLVKKLIPDDILEKFNSYDGYKLVYALVLLSDYFVYDMLKDPVMLSTWINIKN